MTETFKNENERAAFRTIGESFEFEESEEINEGTPLDPSKTVWPSHLIRNQPENIRKTSEFFRNLKTEVRKNPGIITEACLKSLMPGKN